MAWSALDCATRLIELGHLRADRARIEAAKAAIKEAVLTRGFDAKRNTFVSTFEGDDVDASLLYIARVGFLDPDDPRMIGTIDAIRKQLGHDGLVYRYDTRTTRDGLPSGEGAFLACSFWLVEALTLAGRVEEARGVFDDVVRRGNDVGLFSEEIDPESGEFLGNMPQGLSHLALISAATAVAEAGQ
jgi:GH15 family glucan-1,4-alpha-glucosidase